MIRTALVAALAFHVALFSPSTALAQTANDLAGTWTPVSSVTERDGVKTDQFGSAAKGMLMLDANGRFMLTITGPDLPKFASSGGVGTVTWRRAR